MPYSLTHWQTLKDRFTQLLIKYKSGALVTQLWLICQSALFQLQSHHHTISPFAKKDKFWRGLWTVTIVSKLTNLVHIWLGLAWFSNLDQSGKGQWQGKTTIGKNRKSWQSNLVKTATGCPSNGNWVRLLKPESLDEIWNEIWSEIRLHQLFAAFLATGKSRPFGHRFGYKKKLAAIWMLNALNQL